MEKKLQMKGAIPFREMLLQDTLTFHWTNPQTVLHLLEKNTATVPTMHPSVMWMEMEIMKLY